MTGRIGTGRIGIGRIGIPRLLPMTIGVLGLMLVWKTVALVRTAIVSFEPATFSTAAWAGGPDTPNHGEHAEPAAKPKAEPSAEKKPAGTEAAKPEEKPPVETGPPAVTDAEKAVLLELRQRRQELEAREAALAAKESILAAAEMKLTARVGELQSLQSKLESLDASHRQQEDSAWQGLVKVYETMKPRDAAVIFNDLGMPVLLAVIDRMKEAKAAAILAAMSPDRAREVTTQLAQYRTRGPENVATGGSKPGTAATGGNPSQPIEPGKPPGSGT